MLRERVAAVDVFVSYSHRDEELRQELEVHLTALKRQGLIHTWSDRDITAGTGWQDEVERKLTSADVILLLVSPELIASDYCWDKEMIRALRRHWAGEARVIPIILRPCDWQSSPFGGLQALPRDGKPVTLWPHRDEAFLDVVRGLRAVIEELRSTMRATAREREVAQPSVAQEIKPALEREEKVLPRERINPTDGSVLVYVPGGEYVLGAEYIDNSKPVHRVLLSPFWIGKYAVTNEQYGRFLGANPKHPKPGGWEDERLNGPLQPVVKVSWTDAMAYCRWSGLQLPTEAQWEAAARGTDRRPYPWGREEPTAQHARFTIGFGPTQPASVGSYPLGAGPFGTLDQAGNVWEWCADAFKFDAYRERNGKVDPHEPGNNDAERILRVVRGGCWSYPDSFLRTERRNMHHVGFCDQVLGFRVAASVGAEHGD